MKWVGYESALNTWEPERNLTSCKDLVEAYKLQGKQDKFHAKQDRSQHSHILKNHERKFFKESDSEERKDIYIDDENSEGEELPDLSDDIGSNFDLKKKSKKKTVSPFSKKQVEMARRGKSQKKEFNNLVDYCKQEAKSDKIKILEMGRRDRNKYFKVLTNGNVKWVDHKALYPEYAEALC